MPADLATGMFRAAHAQWTEADVALCSVYGNCLVVDSRLLMF